MFCTIRSLWLDLGMATMPRWVSQRRATCAAVLLYFAPIVEETASLEIAHADGTHLSCTIGLLHRPPRAEHVTVGLMDEQQVDILRLQLA